MMRSEVVKLETDLLANLKQKNETIRDVYSISTLYYEKRKGRNSLDRGTKQPHLVQQEWRKNAMMALKAVSNRTPHIPGSISTSPKEPKVNRNLQSQIGLTYNNSNIASSILQPL